MILSIWSPHSFAFRVSFFDIFFTCLFSALSSVLIIQYVLTSNWQDLWQANKFAVPSSPLPNTILTCVLSAGIAISMMDWILCHWLYNSEQDEIEERSKAAHLAGESGSELEHEHDE